MAESICTVPPILNMTAIHMPVMMVSKAINSLSIPRINQPYEFVEFCPVYHARESVQSSTLSPDWFSPRLYCQR
jgi:hypothetical protein